MSTKPADLKLINPMITSDGDTYRVSSVLVALADFLPEEKAITPDGAQSYGLSVILQTCAAALRRMGEIKK